MGIIQRIRRARQTPWYKKDAWVNVNTSYAVETIEEHGCPSWDVGLCRIKTYKHKDSCEERVRVLPFFVTQQVTKTVFDDPTEEPVSFDWLGIEVPHIDTLDVTQYTGCKYE